MNPTAILALIGDLYAQITQLQQELAQAREQRPFDPLAEPHIKPC